MSDFLPANHVTDATVSYEGPIQKAIDFAKKTGAKVVFDPIDYRISKTDGFRIHSGLTLEMNGARFLFDESLENDGQLFSGDSVIRVTFRGGTVIGRNGAWQDGVNIRGIHLTGPCSQIRVQEMHLRDLSSNGVGVFAADAEHPATDITIVDTVIDNCSNKFGDYQAAKNRGVEKGSVREDQGLVALYHVHDFSVRNCRLTDSRSDGTHFYFCENGHFNNNFVYRAKMGGYFLESCKHVSASGNIIRDSGSRGVTIERASQYCVLRGNTISGSGREGLWIPDSLHCVASGNIFSLNGRKTNGTKRNTIWNANITINQARGDIFNTPTAHYLIVNNVIESDAGQVAAIRVDTRTETANIVIQGNLITGENRRILIEGPDQEAVSLHQNSNAVIDREAAESESP